MRTHIFLLTAALLLATWPARAQTENLISLSFEDAPLEQPVELYREWTGRTIIKQADLSAKITLKGRQLTQDEAKQAIETVLAMHGVALVPMGEKFLKVVPIANARQEGLAIQPFDPEQQYPEADQLITQVIPLRYVLFADVQPLIQHLVHGYGKIIQMDRINSVLVTDTSANIARIVELINMVDQPVEKIEPRIYQLQFAEADTLAAKLKELVEAAKTKKGEQTVVAAGARTIPGVIRAPAAAAPAAAEPSSGPGEETEMIQGEVKFVSDERTNILIIFSKAANFDFFDRIIKVLDVPVDPAVVVEVVNLEYAKATEISGILNEFVGAAKATEKSQAEGKARPEGSQTVEEVIRRSVEPAGLEISPEAKSAIGRLSEDTRILSDERTNSLLLMGRKSDIEALRQVIASLDVMLEQVMIEAVILSVGLGDKLSTGIQWVYDTQDSTNATRQLLGWNGGRFDAATNTVIGSLGSSLTYYGIFPEINMQALINATKSDSDARILSTPVVLTTDNTEAAITVGEERPVVSSSINSTSDSFSARATYEYRNIGITLTVTPNINPQGFVVMEITQTADDILDTTTIDNNEVPIIAKREISATVAVQDRSTIVLGGLVRKASSRSASKIPILGDIPLLGWFFSTHNNTDDRSELVVLLTPYVLNNPDEAQRETRRIYEASDSSDTLWPRGWSESPLRNEEPEPDAWKNRKSRVIPLRDEPAPEKARPEPARSTEQILQELRSGNS